MRSNTRVHAREAGSVTAELAVALPALLILLCAALWSVATASAQLRCLDAAREGARASARGEAPEIVLDAVRRAAPASATVQVRREGGLVHVSVSAAVAPLGQLARRAPSLRVSGRASAAVEVSLPQAGGGR